MGQKGIQILMNMTKKILIGAWLLLVLPLNVFSVVIIFQNSQYVTENILFGGTIFFCTMACATASYALWKKSDA